VHKQRSNIRLTVCTCTFYCIYFLGNTCLCPND